MELNYFMREELPGHNIPRKEEELICFAFPIFQSICQIQIQLHSMVFYMEWSTMWGISNLKLRIRMPPVLSAILPLALPW
jgi:hypothetical protein